MAHDTYIKYRGTKDEWQRIKDAAEASGVDASKLMRDAVMNRVKRIERKGETGHLLAAKTNADRLMGSIEKLNTKTEEGK